MSRISLKIVGASGQGINSIGEILAKGLKRSGYCVFGYREYPSLIKGGHASYQLDVSDERIESSEVKINVLITLNHHGLELNLPELKQGGIVIHSSPNWVFTEEHKELIAKQQLNVIELPVDEVLKRLKAKPILGNVLIAAYVWAALGLPIDDLKNMVGERFAKKKDLLELNMKCIEEGFAEHAKSKTVVAIPPPHSAWKNHMLLTGSHAMGLGAVHAGVRLYAGYPMTPSSPLLSYIADLQNKTGMVIKQAEDEITAAQMVSGAMHMGTRALTATSGGGFDLMSETVSLNGIIENPTVFVLAQRPGPATGLPTWTAQGDLLLAVGSAHGEFARCVLSVSDAQDAFDLMPVAFNLAEKYQISVIVLTDKQIAEALYTQEPYDQSKATIERGIVTDKEELKQLKSSDRFHPRTADGVSPRWLPGTEAATYNAQGDEHSGNGTIDESAENAKAQMDKRMKKLEALKAALPEPKLSGIWKDKDDHDWMEKEIDLLVVSWGSNGGIIRDVLWSAELRGKKIAYLHYTYLWPLRTEELQKLAKRANRTVLVECTYQGQLGMLLKMECGFEFDDKILKYDGRPFFYDELLEAIRNQVPLKKRLAEIATRKKTVKKTPKSKDVQKDTPLSNEPTF